MAGIEVERSGAVTVLTINRPEVANTLDPPALHALCDALDAGRVDPTIGAAVLAATGNRTFCAGFDLRALRQGGTEVGESIERFRSVMQSPERLPIVAAVGADAVGGGFELVLQCDLAVAANHVGFLLPEVGRGLVPGGGATLLPTRIPLAVALEIGIAGGRLDAPRAEAFGLVNRVVTRGKVRSTAIEMAARIAANAPLAVATTRQLMWSTAVEGPAASQARAEMARDDPGRAAEQAEGLAAFAEKRQPRWPAGPGTAG